MSQMANQSTAQGGTGEIGPIGLLGRTDSWFGPIGSIGYQGTIGYQGAIGPRDEPHSCDHLCCIHIMRLFKKQQLNIYATLLMIHGLSRDSASMIVKFLDFRDLFSDDFHKNHHDLFQNIN